MIRVVLADDHPVVRTGYARLLEAAGGIAVVGEAGDAQAAFDACLALQPDVLVTDLSMPGIGGLELIRRLRAKAPTLRILVCSMHDSPALVQRALATGASGFVAKSSPPEALVDAVREVHQGRRAVPADVPDAAAQADAAEAGRLASLTEREHALLRLLAQGQTLAGCARALSLSTKTASNYQSLIREKLGIGSNAQLVHLAMRHGIVAAPGDALAGPTLGTSPRGGSGKLP